MWPTTVSLGTVVDTNADFYSPRTSLKGDLWRGYVYSERINPTPHSTPVGTTTAYPQQEQQSPQVYRFHNQHLNKPVIVKAMRKDQDYNNLLDEVAALERLSVWQWIGPIAPKVREHFRVDDSTNTVFTVVNFLGSDDAPFYGWIKLSELLNQPTSIWNGHQAKLRDLHSLQIALYSTIRRMHMVGVVHGDLKDDHILIHWRKLNTGEKKYDFHNIRLIDFGFSYVRYGLRKKRERTYTWKGGTPGFHNPIYWNKANRFGLSWQRLKALDYYSANATLFYALTGECFPASSATYASLADGREIIYQRTEYYEAVSEAQIDYTRKKSPRSYKFLKSFLEDLCSPTDFSSPIYTASMTGRLWTYISQNSFSIVVSLLISLLLYSGLSLLGISELAMTTWMLSGLGVIWFVVHPMIRKQVSGEKSKWAVGGWSAGILVLLFLLSNWFGRGAVLSSGMAIAAIGLFLGITALQTYRFQDELDSILTSRFQRLISTEFWLLFSSVIIPTPFSSLIPLLGGRFYPGGSWLVDGSMIVAIALSALLGWLMAIFRNTPFLYGWSVPQESIGVPILVSTIFIWIGLFFFSHRSQKRSPDHTRIWLPLLWLISCLLGWIYPFVLAIFNEKRIAFGNHDALVALVLVFLLAVIGWPLADIDVFPNEEELSENEQG